LAASVAMLAAAPATARADVLWDFVQLIGSSGDKGTSTGAIANGAFGTFTAFTDAGTTTTHVFAKGFGLPITDAEKGLGVCTTDGAGAGGCLGDEIGEVVQTVPGGSLYISFSLAAGSVLNTLYLGSLQTGENFSIYWSATGVAGTYTNLLLGGTGVGGTDIIAAAAGDHRFYRFDAAGGTGGRDWLVQAASVETAIPEPGTMGLLATGLIALSGAGLIRRRRRKNQ
jgi:hypothetical protein